MCVSGKRKNHKSKKDDPTQDLNMTLETAFVGSDVTSSSLDVNISANAVDMTVEESDFTQTDITDNEPDDTDSVHDGIERFAQ